MATSTLKIAAIPGDGTGPEVTAEALKVLGRVGQSLDGRLLILDALTMQWRQVRIPRDPHCAVCGDSAAHPTGEA